MGIREGGDSGIPAACTEDSAMGICFKELADNVIKQLEFRNLNLKPTERVRVKKG
jgi:ATP-binding protein involved in chromosome partitioning